MPSWFKTKLRSSFSGLLSTHAVPAAAAPPGDGGVTLEDIRQVMLEMTTADKSERAVKLARRIRYAADVETLWFMRGELMALLARTRGEAAAWDELASLSALFTDLLPSGLRSRPSPLSSTFRGTAAGNEEE